MGEGLSKEQWPLSALLSGRKLSPALTLMPNNSVPPCMSLVPFKMLPQHWSSELMSLSSVCRPFRRNCLGLQKPSVSLSHSRLWFLQPEVMGTYLPGTGSPGWGTWYGTGTTHSSVGTSTSSISLLIFNCHMWVWDPVHFMSLLVLPVCGFFLYILCYRTSV